MTSRSNLDESYIKDVSNYPNLTDDEQQKAFNNIILAKHFSSQLIIDNQKIIDDSNASRELIVNSYQRLVISIATRYHPQTLDIEDLVMEGNMALLKAVDKFDPSLGFKFTTYASNLINNRMKRVLSTYDRTIKVPTYLAESKSKMHRIKNDLQESLGRVPTNREIGELIHLKSSQVKDIKSIDNKTLSLDVKVTQEDKKTFLDFIPSTHILNSEEIYYKEFVEHLIIKQGFKLLNKQQREVLTLLYGLETDKETYQKEIANKFNISETRITQIKNASINILKTYYQKEAKRKIENLKTFLSNPVHV
ncbi:MAG: sigma-70 family RNA polymerase sigma factor [Acholeplasmataceae bacterium]|nr:sigma-70 family RNA polymerase sigma factor [Acholeplasmataceae bacterium]